MPWGIFNFHKTSISYDSHFKGYWRINKYRDVIYPCANFPSNCLGGPENFTCSEGHIGPLCEECDLYGEFWPSEYSHSDQFSCGLCSKYVTNIVILIVMSVITVAFIVIAVKGIKYYFYF
jgi:hypothetical protein